ncbi:SDR family NAD(P)-dependent oxidoreductase [Streptomyces sp. NPDC004393]|uniref:SDR family NAD(P)-dependent oxidoreductase n=1 Tax=Streptomyces sp. NPDC004533 TaxID=3154278 RepID=UPI0033AB5EA6
MAKTWFITGSSRGFGREWAEAALERGDHVAATARDISRLTPLAERYGDAVLPVRLDVTNRAAVHEAVQLAHSHFGSLDIAVNNAGYGHFGMVEEVNEDDLRAQMETNFFGAMWVTQAVLPLMRSQRSGRILQVTSEGGVRAFPGIGAYHASKWALEGLSESLAQEVAAFGIHVTNVEPGPYATDWLARGARHSEQHPDYTEVRAATALDFEVGDPRATRDAILRIVDADQPPLRIFLGKSFTEVAGLYEERLSTWRQWQPVSLTAFG